MTETIKHHPDSVTLIGFANGSLPSSLAAVVATHVMMCKSCQRDIARLEAIGGALLPDGDARAPALREPSPTASALLHAEENASAPLMPAAAWRAFGLTPGHIPWRRLGIGVSHFRLPPGQTGGDLRFLKIAPGLAVPEHGHGGTELTLVLSGAFSDVTGTYGPGDVQDVDGDIEHQPKVTPDGECICIVASEHPAQFKTMLGRISQLWTGF